MVILLTGSTGFIGRNLKEYLQDRYHLLTPTHKELDFADEKVREYLFKYKTDIIIHCACKDTPDCFNENMKMFNNLLKYKPENCRMITFGSGIEFHEENNSDYARAKRLQTKIAQIRNDIMTIRLWGCYGKYERKIRFITAAILCKLQGKVLTIHQDKEFSYFYINDLCHKIEEVINFKEFMGISINATSMPTFKLSEIAKMVGVKYKIKNKIIGKPYVCKGIEAYTPMKDAIKEMEEWYAKNP